MSKRLSKSLIIVLAILTFGGYEAYACFVQGKEPIWNTFAKKKLELTIDFSGYYNKLVDGHPNAGHWKPQDLSCQDFFHFDDVKPGDFGEGTISLHLKNQDAWGCAIIRPTENNDHGSSEPELLVDAKDNSKDQWDGELAQNLNLRVWADICAVSPAKPGDNIFQPNCDKILYDKAAPLNSLKLVLADSANQNVFTGKTESIKHDKDYYLGADWNVPSVVGNIIQTDTYKADVTFYTEQAEGNDGFKCADINDKDPNKCVDGASRSCYYGDPATRGVGICTGGTETCAHGDWGKCIGEIQPDKEICADGIDNNCDGKVDESVCVCQKNSQCDDKNAKTDDLCIAGTCVNKQKSIFKR